MRILGFLFAGAALASCVNVEIDRTADESLAASDALRPYYAQVQDSDLPIAPIGAPLNTEEPLNKILIGSCFDEEVPDNSMRSMAAENADLFLFIGDNVYGDVDDGWLVTYDLDLTELRRSYADLAANADFQKLRASTPMMIAWDDHDYGINDGGREFPSREFSERIFEHFWRLSDEDLAGRPGIYTSKIFGPVGQRTQVIMLDTRYFRSNLTRTDERVPGKERYLDSTAQDQALLGETQWTWLESQLRKDAEIRILASSIQVTPDAHGWESWDKLPKERQRLYDLIRSTGATGTIIVSGDRHTGFLYRDSDRGPHPLFELTASSMNKSFSDAADSTETDPRQIDKGYAFTNFGEIEIDWTARRLALNIKSESGGTVRRQSVSFDEIGVPAS